MMSVPSCMSLNKRRKSLAITVEIAKSITCNSASVQNEQVKQHFTEHLSVEVTLVKVW